MGESERQEAKRIGFDSLDLFIGFDPGRMTLTERRETMSLMFSSVDLPINSLVCTCLGLSDFNPASRSDHIERAKNVLELATAISSTRNLCFDPGRVHVPASLAAGGERVEARGRRHAAGRTTCRRTATELAIELLFEFAFIKTLDVYGALPGRRRPGER